MLRHKSTLKTAIHRLRWSLSSIQFSSLLVPELKSMHLPSTTTSPSSIPFTFISLSHYHSINTPPLDDMILPEGSKGDDVVAADLLANDDIAPSPPLPSLSPLGSDASAVPHNKISSLSHSMYDSVSVNVGNWSFEVGRLARKADGSCSLRCGATTVLATIATAPLVFLNRRDLRSIPITVDYREKLYAVGRIPSTYNKREGAPKEHELLAARRLERAFRPLLPRGFSYPTDITAAILSADGAADPEVLAINAASAAFAVSNVPWSGPLGAARVAFIDGEFVINPRPIDIEQKSDFSLLVAATEDCVVMLEASAETTAIPESKFLEALRLGVSAARNLLPAQKQLASARGTTKRCVDLAGADPAAARRVIELARQAASSILQTSDLNCNDRMQALMDEKDKIVKAMQSAGSMRSDFARVPGSGCVSNTDIDHTFAAALGSSLRSLAIEKGLRPDGRGPIDVRPIVLESDHVPVVHGSAVVDAGDTQTLCTATIGSMNDSQKTESLLGGEDTKRLFVHYSLPDFALVDGAERSGASGGPLVRHEMDRSSFIERSLFPILPSEFKFPFSVRINAEALAADGGSSATAVCGGTMALADAGVPLHDLVAAVSVGLLSESGAWNGEGSTSDAYNYGGPLGQYELVTDPIQMEVSMGDMELRVAGTEQGITACQLDVQLPGGVPLEVIEEAVERAKIARLRRLAVIKESLPSPKDGQKSHAPLFGTIRVPPTAIGAIIGKEGSKIRGIKESSGAQIHIADSGFITIFAPSAEQYELAAQSVRAAAGENLEKGLKYRARVMAVKDFGAFVEIPGCEARCMLHISEIATERIKSVEDVLKVGESVDVIFLGRDQKGTLRVSRKAVLTETQNRDHAKAPAAAAAAEEQQ